MRYAAGRDDVTGLWRADLDRAAAGVRRMRSRAGGARRAVGAALRRGGLLGWCLLAAAGIPVGDALIVLRSKGPRATAYGVHAATALVMVTIAVLLLAG